jgi:hypothetical protein
VEIPDITEVALVDMQVTEERLVLEVQLEVLAVLAALVLGPIKVVVALGCLVKVVVEMLRAVVVLAVQVEQPHAVVFMAEVLEATHRVEKVE